MDEYCTELQVHSFEYKWTIKNLILLLARVDQKQTGIKLKSSSFSVGNDQNIKWRFTLNIRNEIECHRVYHSVRIGLSVVCKKLNKKQLIWENVTSFIMKRKKPSLWAIVTPVLLKKNGETFGTGERHLFEVIPGKRSIRFPYDNAITEFLKKADINDFRDEFTIACRFNIFDDINTFSEKNLVSKVDKKHLSSDFIELLEGEKFTDVTFVMKGKKLKAHKTILAARSPVFAAMFDHPMKEKNDNEVHVDDIDADVFKEMLRYIYANEVVDLKNMAVNLLYAADKYGLEGLKEMCGTSIWNEITIDNAADAYIFADRHNLKQLMELIHNFIDKSIRDVMKTAGFKNMENEHPQLTNVILRRSLEKFQPGEIN